MAERPEGMGMADQQHIYKILFHNQTDLRGLCARSSKRLYGFIEVEDYIFGDIKVGSTPVRPAAHRVRRRAAQLHSDGVIRMTRSRKKALQDQRRQRRYEHRSLSDADPAQRGQALAGQ
jgi:hypothetical protein